MAKLLRMYITIWWPQIAQLWYLNITLENVKETQMSVYVHWILAEETFARLLYYVIVQMRNIILNKDA